MADIRVQVDDSFMRNLRHRLGMESNPEVVKEALSILAWAVGELREGRFVVSTDRDGANVNRLVTPGLEHVRQLRAEPVRAER